MRACVHRSVHRRVFAHLCHRLERLGRPHLEVEDVLPVDPHERLLVLGRVGRAVPLVAAQHVLHVLRPARAEARERVAPERVRRRAAGEHEVLEARGTVRGDVLDGERDAPGLPEEVKVVRDAEVPQEVVQLGDEERRRDGEARRLVAQARRVARAQLVVEHDGMPPRAVQVGVREHVPVRDARSAVQHDEGSRAGLEVAEDRIRRLERF